MNKKRYRNRPAEKLRGRRPHGGAAIDRSCWPSKNHMVDMERIVRERLLRGERQDPNMLFDGARHHRLCCELVRDRMAPLGVTPRKRWVAL